LSALAWLASASVSGCDPERTAAPVDAGGALEDASPIAYFDAAAVPPGAPAFCHRPGSDRVRDLFCAPQPPRIDSLRSLQAALDLVPPSVKGSSYGTLAIFLGHSTALSGHLVSSINPRAIMIGPSLSLTYQRGVQQVEVAASARTQDVRAGLQRHRLHAHGPVLVARRE
jgi:hypothetical protein